MTGQFPGVYLVMPCATGSPYPVLGVHVHTMLDQQLRNINPPALYASRDTTLIPTHVDGTSLRVIS